MSTREYETIQLRGAPEGMDYTSSVDEIKETQARYLQDLLVDKPPLLVRRGRIDLPALQSYAVTGRPLGFLSTLNPAGNVVSAILRQTSTGSVELGILTSDLTGISQFILNGVLTGTLTVANANDPICDIKPMLNGGLWIGIADGGISAGSVANAYLFMWRGGANVRTANSTTTVSLGGTSVTGSGTSWSTTVSPGMFLLSPAGILVGVVASVQSNTALTLEAPALVALAAVTNCIFTPVRGFQPRIASGVINVASGSTSVTGAGTAFVDEETPNSSFLYRKKDNTFIGTLSAQPTDNYALTLNAGAAVAMNGEEYFILPGSPDYSESNITGGLAPTVKKVGLFTAIYAGRQWYANRPVGNDVGGSRSQRLWFSDTVNPENVNMSPANGSYIMVTDDTDNEPIYGIVATRSALVVFKASSTWGIFGDSPDTFSVKKIADDGCLSTMTAVPRDDGVIWAGKKGIYFWDGVEAENLISDTLQTYWNTALLKFNPSVHRAWATTERDHYLFSSNYFNPPFPLNKTFSHIPTNLGIAIYLPTKAVSTLSNFAFRYAAALPSPTGYEHWFLVAGQTNKSINSDFETNISGWTNISGTATLSRDSTHSWLGDWSLKVIPDVAGGSVGATVNELTSTQGQVVELSAWVFSSFGEETMRIGMDEYQGSSTYRTTTWGPFFQLPAGWSKITASIAVADSLTTAVRTRIEYSSSLVNGFYLDDVRIYSAANAALGDFYMRLCDFKWFFDGEGVGSGVDFYITGKNDRGPDMYFESRGLDAGDAARRKRFKMLVGTYKIKTVGTDAVTDVIRVITVKGLGDTGVLVNTTLPGETVGVYNTTKVKLSVPTQVIRYRLFQPSQRIQTAVIGPADVVYKWQRPGRV